MDKEPRREAMVPSSTTVTPLAATCRPMRPANAEVCLRLKSPSSPWPTASCSITPGQPAPSTTSISPAGAGTDSRYQRLADRAIGGLAPGFGLNEAGITLSAAIALAAAYLAIARAGDH